MTVQEEAVRGHCRVQAYKDKELEEPAVSSSNLSADFKSLRKKPEELSHTWTVSYKLNSAVLAE